MNENQPAFALDVTEGTPGVLKGRIQIIGLELGVSGKPLQLQIGVTDRPVTLADIVPLARELSNRTTQFVSERVQGGGNYVLCRKGCYACCRYLVPLSVPEVFRLRNEVMEMPSHQRESILRPWLQAAERVLQSVPSQLKDQAIKPQLQNSSNITEVARWYGGLDLDCPFLANGLCTIYEQRPIACREHIVIGSTPPSNSKCSCDGLVAQMPVHILDALAQLAAEVEGLDTEAVMLPLALAWSEQNIHRSMRKWPAPMLVERLINIVTNVSQPKYALADNRRG